VALPLAVPVNKGPLPIIVAVTGHIDIRPEDTTALGDRVREILQRLQRKYPHTEIELLSPLAEGADRLVARVALEFGIRLVAPLPMEPDEFKKDFADADSIREFDELRAKAVRTFVVKGPNGLDDPRPHCYARVAAYNVTHCHLLLALWNGLWTHKIGGTSEVVRFCLKRVPLTYTGFGRLLDPVDTTMVYHVVTPRRSDPSTNGTPLTVRPRAPLPPGLDVDADDEPSQGEQQRVAAALQSLERVFANTDRFNEHAAESGNGAEERRERSRSDLMTQGRTVTLAPEAETIRTLYGYADELAIRYQRRRMRTLNTLFVVVFLTVVAFEFFAHGLGENTGRSVTIFLYLLLLSGAYSLWWMAERGGVDKKYLDYRALAEGLRVQFYWRLAHVPGSVAEYYMRYRLQEVEWIRNAFRACEIAIAGSEADNSKGESALGELTLVIANWVDRQYQYFAGTAGREKHRLEFWEDRSRILAAQGLVVAFVVLGVTIILGPETWADMEETHRTGFVALMALIGLSTAAVALISGYVEKRALSAHIKRFARMTILFERAKEQLAEPMENGDWDGARDVLRELGREALEENADWVMLHRERPLEVPK
jgi:hypothetical protein